MNNIPETAILMQEGLMWNPLPYGGEIFAIEGYHFYNIEVLDNYDRYGILLPKEERIWCTYMTCICKTSEEANKHIVGEKINE